MRTEDDEGSANEVGSAEESKPEAEAEAQPKEEANNAMDIFGLIEEGDIAKVKELIKSGDCDLDERDQKTKDTPLTLAIKTGNLEMIKLLLEEGAPSTPSIINLWSNFSVNNRSTLRTVQIAELLQDFIKCRTRNVCGAAQPVEKADNTMDIFGLIEKGDFAKVKELIKSGDCDLDQQDRKTKDTPLTLAIKTGNLEMVKLLLEEGAPGTPSVFNLWSSFSVNKVPASRNTQIAELLLDYGAEVDTGNMCPLTPLIQASRLGAVEIVRVLLDRGADIEKSSDYEYAPMALRWDLDFCIDSAYSDRRCEPFHPGNTPLMEACRYGRLETARLLIERGADIHKGNSINNTALHTASCSESLRIYFACYGEDKPTPTLHTNPSVVELLLEKGADPAKENNLKLTPLDLVLHHIDTHELFPTLWHEQREDLFKYFTNVSLLVKAGCPVDRVIKDISEKYEGQTVTASVPTLQVLTNAYAALLTIPSDLDLLEPDSYVPLDEGYVKAMKSVVLSGVKPSPREVGELRDKVPVEATSDIVQSMLDWLVDVSSSGYSLRQLCQMCLRSCIGRPLRLKVSDEGLKIPHYIKSCILLDKDV